MHIHIFHALNRVIQPIIQPTTKNMKEKNHIVMELQCVAAGKNSISSGKWHGDKCLRLL